MRTVQLKNKDKSSFNIIDEQFNSLIGFNDNIEVLPNIFDKFDSKEKLRQLFLHMSNIVFKKSCNFSKYEQVFLSHYDLKQAFEYKINKSLNQTIFIKKQAKKFNFCKYSTIIINNYLNESNSNIYFASKKCKVLVASLISSCFKNGKLTLFIDKNLLFHEFVLNKLRKLHFDKKVIDLGDCICIKSDNFQGLMIYTSWKNIDVKNPDIKVELENAIRLIKAKKYYQIYLAYPKTNSFKRQIPIYVDELKNKEYQIKAIPYSMRSIIK